MSLFAIKFISGKYQGGEFPIPRHGELLIGRANDLDLVLVEDMVSRKHAKLVAGGQQLNITDLGSTNGTFVNGEKVRRADLHRNDRVLIGTSILKIIMADEMTMNQDADAKSFREMMEDLANRPSDTSTMSGDLEEVPLPDLLQLFATNKKSGILRISGPNRGKVFIKNGQIQYAAIISETAMRPMKAICRMVGWERGAFTMEEWTGQDTLPECFEESTESILMEALRQHDEMRKMLSQMPSPDAPLTLCIPMVPKLSALSANELDTLQLVLNFNTFQSVIDKTSGTDFETLSHVNKLLRNGYLEVE